ncbi:MAG TPA: hypothetical protein V6C71_20665 [Coleofasciculaceae cyanobacterium]|jgi:hypothetical protein
MFAINGSGEIITNELGSAVFSGKAFIKSFLAIDKPIVRSLKSRVRKA